MEAGEGQARAGPRWGRWLRGGGRGDGGGGQAGRKGAGGRGATERDKRAGGRAVSVGRNGRPHTAAGGGRRAGGGLQGGRQPGGGGQRTVARLSIPSGPV
jgi:hypothetical protein